MKETKKITAPGEMMEKKKKPSCLLKGPVGYLLLLALFAAVAVGYAWHIGLLQCGYYFSDDHEIVRLTAWIRRDGLWAALTSWVGADLNQRFRPLYMILRVLEAFFFGNHVKAWHLLKTLECAVIVWLSYILARRMKAGPVAALLFATVGFAGSQCAIFYRLGPQEPLALLLMLAGLLCAVMRVEAGCSSKGESDTCVTNETLRKKSKVCDSRSRRLWTAGFHLCMIGMMTTKEAFLMLVPICVLFLLYVEVKVGLSATTVDSADGFASVDADGDSDDAIVDASQNKNSPWRLFLGALRRNLTTVIFQAALSVAALLFVIKYTGTNSIIYAGIDTTYTAKDYLVGGLAALTGEFLPYLILCGVAVGINVVLCVGMAVVNRSMGKRCTADDDAMACGQKLSIGSFLFLRFCELLFVLYVLFTQALLYAKSGMGERYQFPAITGVLIYVFCMSLPVWGESIRQCMCKKSRCGGDIAPADVTTADADDDTPTADGRHNATIAIKLLATIPTLCLLIWSILMFRGSGFHTLCLDYTVTCSYNTQMLYYLGERIEAYRADNGEDPVIIVSNTYSEWNLAMCAFLQELYDVETTYGYATTGTSDVATDRYVLDGEAGGSITIDQGDIFVAQTLALPEKMLACGIDYRQLDEVVFGTYIIYEAGDYLEGYEE